MNTDLKLEILISTMNRVSLDFLVPMFPFHNLDDLNILIVNQTEEGGELVSKHKNIRVINSYDKGLSKSRNLAIGKAIGDICLIADDDVEYLENFTNIILKEFYKLSKVSAVTFKIKTFCEKPYKKYPTQSRIINKSDFLKNCSSVEIAFKRKDIQNNNIHFNDLFGLGSCFPSGEEYLFLKSITRKNLVVFFKNTFILKHSLLSSTSNITSDNYIKTKTVLYYLDYKYLCYLYLLKFLVFLIRKKIMVYDQFYKKFKVGVLGVKKYKNLTNGKY